MKIETCEQAKNIGLTPFAMFAFMLITFPGYAADLVLQKGNFYTANDKQPHASAIVIDAGKIVYVGDEDGSLSFVTAETKVVDLKGQTVLPGFIDSHNHVFEGASEVGGGCLLSPTRSLKKQKHLLEACKRSISTEGEWIIGYGHQLDVLMSNNPETNPRQFLDRIFPDNPVVIMEESSHSMLANSLALDVAGFDESTTHPQGGRIMRSPKTDLLNGVLFDSAGDIVMEIAWNSIDSNAEESYQGLLAGMQQAVCHGITTIGDGRLYWRRGWYDIWQSALDNDDIIVRTSLRPWIYPELEAQTQIDFLTEIVNNNLEDLLIVNQVKLYIDGVLHFGTAKVLNPYLSSWQTKLPHGLNYIDPSELPPLLGALNKIGMGAHIHAIGDGGVRESLNAIEKVRALGSNRKYSLTHLELVDPADIGRFESLGVDTDFQAGADFFGEHSWARPYIGPQQSKNLMPMREVFNTGANVTFSSDWTVNSINPLAAVSNSVLLRESIGLPNLDDALHAATINGAYALGLQSTTGSIEVGKSADLVGLDRNILELDPADIRAAEVVFTMLRGKIVYGDGEFN